MQKDIDSGGGAGYPPKNMTMQIKDGNCNVEMGMFQTLYHLFESEHVILSPQIRILRFDIFSTSKNRKNCFTNKEVHSTLSNNDSSIHKYDGK